MQAQGISVPALARMPELPPWAETFARAYQDLRGERSAAGVLRWSAVMRWASAAGMRDGFALWDVLQSIDAEIHTWLARKSASRQSLPAPRLKSTH
jgi:hypothetical protein